MRGVLSRSGFPHLLQFFTRLSKSTVNHEIEEDIMKAASYIYIYYPKHTSREFRKTFFAWYLTEYFIIFSANGIAKWISKEYWILPTSNVEKRHFLNACLVLVTTDQLEKKIPYVQCIYYVRSYCMYSSQCSYFYPWQIIWWGLLTQMSSNCT